MRLPACLALATLLTAAAPARADGFTPAESARLVRGEIVTRAEQVSRGGEHLVGGVSYAIVDATPDDLASLLDDVDAWRRFLPRTREATLLAKDGPTMLVHMTHGNALLQVEYVMRVRREGDVVRFWMDPTQPHDIADAWGYLRATPLASGRTLLTWGILLDMGPGLLRDLFETRVQQLALSVPERVRDAVVEKLARGRRASR